MNEEYLRAIFMQNGFSNSMIMKYMWLRKISIEEK